MSSLLLLEAPCTQGHSETTKKVVLCGWKYLSKLPRLSLGGQGEQSSKDRDSLASFKEVCKGRKHGSWNGGKGSLEEPGSCVGTLIQVCVNRD